MHIFLSNSIQYIYYIYIYAYTCIHSAHAHKNSKLITNKMKKILNLYVLLDMGCLELTGAAMPCKSFATTSRGFWPASQPAAFAGQVLSTVMQSEWTVIVHHLHFYSCTAGSGQSFGFFCQAAGCLLETLPSSPLASKETCSEHESGAANPARFWGPRALRVLRCRPESLEEPSLSQVLKVDR